MQTPKITDEFLEITKQIQDEKRRKSKILMRKKWFSENWISLSSLIVAVIALVISLLK